MNKTRDKLAADYACEPFTGPWETLAQFHAAQLMWMEDFKAGWDARDSEVVELLTEITTLRSFIRNMSGIVPPEYEKVFKRCFKEITE